jgi:hypothetical protein
LVEVVAQSSCFEVLAFIKNRVIVARILNIFVQLVHVGVLLAFNQLLLELVEPLCKKLLRVVNVYLLDQMSVVVLVRCLWLQLVFHSQRAVVLKFSRI